VLPQLGLLGVFDADLRIVTSSGPVKVLGTVGVPRSRTAGNPVAGGVRRISRLPE
jgi:hypothetical protein